MDDGSSDESPRILAATPCNFSRVPLPAGLARARNLLVEKARGEFVTFLDQDDLVVSESFSKRLELLLSCPELPAVVGEIADVIDHKGQSLGSFEKLSGKSPRGKPSHLGLIAKRTSDSGGVVALSFCAEFLKSMGPFLPEWDVLTDQEFLYRVLRKHSIVHRNFPVARMLPWQRSPGLV